MARPREARSSCDSVTAASCPVGPYRARTVRMFHVKLSTTGPDCADRRCSTWNTGASEQRALGRGDRRGGGRPPGSARRCSSTCTVVVSSTRSVDHEPEERRGPSAGQRSGCAGGGGSLTISRPPRRSRGLAHSAVVAGRPKLRATTASAVPRRARAADHLGPTLDDLDGEAQRLDRSLEEAAALGPSLHQDQAEVRPSHRQHQPGDASAAAEVDHHPVGDLEGAEEGAARGRCGTRPARARGSPSRRACSSCSSSPGWSVQVSSPRRALGARRRSGAGTAPPLSRG